MEENVNKFYDKLVCDRLVPEDRNKRYQELVEILFSECLGHLSPNVLRRVKRETICILLNLAKFSFEKGLGAGFKLGLDICNSGNHIIVTNSKKEERQHQAQKAGKQSGITRNSNKEFFYQLFIQGKMWKMTHKDILADNRVINLKQKFNISESTIDKKWIPDAKKRRIKEKSPELV